MDDMTILGAALGQLGQTVKQAAKQVVKIPEEMAQAVGGQVGSAPQRPGSEVQAKPGEPKQWTSDEERIKFLKDLYGKPDENLKTGEPQIKKEESPEEQKKLLELRQQLHKENYYEPTFNRPQKQEERPAEKVENEKRQEIQDLQKKEEKKPPPLAAQRAAQRVENIPGAG